MIPNEELKSANLNKLADVAESLFQKSNESEDLWRLASTFALQLTQGQIYALTRIKFSERQCYKASEIEDNEERKQKLSNTAETLSGFYDDYIKLQNQRNTGLFILQVVRAHSMIDFLGKGIQGQVKIDK